jgi:hypothetical protein
MSFDNLHRDNILLFAMKAYDKPNCILSELDEDLKHFNYVRRLFRRYIVNGELKDRLILNHIVILYNLFGSSATRLLFYHSRPEEYSTLKTFLVFLGRMPDRIVGIRGVTLLTADIQIDPIVVDALRKLITTGGPHAFSD